MQYTSKRAKKLIPNSIFSKMNKLAQNNNVINFGIGFPDYPASDFIKEAAIQAIKNDMNQYASCRGLPKLRQAIVDRMQNRYQVSYHPDTDVILTQGATEAIFATMQALVDPGDEVIMFEPCYTTYLPGIQLAGGIPRFYTFFPPDWSLDEVKLKSMFSDKTRLILINTPHNPTGRVFNDKEMSLIAELCLKYDVIAVSDEVYEDLIFDSKKYIPLCTYPGMHNRTVTVSTFGKTFGVTGWKVGWTVSSPELAEPILRIHEYVCGSGTAPVQEAAAQALSMPQSFYDDVASQYEAKRNYLCSALKDSGFNPIVPSGTFFLWPIFLILTLIMILTSVVIYFRKSV